ncbi:MAG TPA: hypothetical protein VLS96_21820 [Nodosilinea sp.]|nr:hypothetical protein [Nodosilinea sp.]
MTDSPPASVEISLTDDRSRLYVFFGGLAAEMPIPPFEFYNSSKIIDENKLFIRDFSQCWYHNGLANISTDIPTTADYLRQQIATINPQRLFLVGNSMGGYAAILFAHLLGQGEVIAFAPQTFIGPLLRFRHGDHRWKRKIKATYKKSLLKPKAWDLKPLLRHSASPPKVSIFVASNHRLDSLHANRIRGMGGVHIHGFESGGHDVVKLLRDQGCLPEIMAGTYCEGAIAPAKD